MGCPTSYEGKTATWSKGKLSRLSSGSLAAGSSSFTYSYNAFGQRIARNYSYMQGTSGLTQLQDGQVTAYNKKYYYDHLGRLIAETSVKNRYNETALAERIVFLYDESGMIGMEYTPANGSAQLYYFQRNLLGDVVAIYDTSGALKVKYLYDAWGNCTISSETTNQALAKANPIRYRGYYYDDDTGLYYCNARYYSPKWRRFISPATDLINPEVVNGLNTYTYANNNPISPHFKASTTHVAKPMAHSVLMQTNKNDAQRSRASDPLSFSVGLVTPESRNLPPWMDVYCIYVKGSLGWGYTFGDGYSLASFSIGVLDATFHTPKWFAALPADHLANPNIYLGAGTWNANVSVGVGISGTAEIISGTIGIQFGDAVSFGAKGYVGIGFTLDFTNGIRFGVGWGLGYELYLAIDWYELFN